MYFTYILYSPNFSKYYIGQTKDINARLIKHNNKQSVYTRKFAPWIVIYIEKFKNRSEAIKREKEIKSYKGGNKFKALVQSHPAKRDAERAT